MLADANEYRMYWLCQAFGWSALLWAWLTTMFGLGWAGRVGRTPGADGAPLNVEQWMLWAGTAALLLAIAVALTAARRAYRVRAQE